MGCCGSKDTGEDEVAEIPPGKAQAGLGKVYKGERYGVVCSIRPSEQPQLGSRGQFVVRTVYDQEDDEIGGKEQSHLGSREPEPVASIGHLNVIAHSAQHNEERHFFQVFFSVMDHFPDYQGILRRWEREDQQAEFKGGRCDMGKVWGDRSGYVKSLHLVKLFVANNKFTSDDRLKLAGWAVKVVARRTKEYKAAEAEDEEDPKHLKVLEAWGDVKNTLQNLT